MAMITDRDLAVIEPLMFVDAVSAATLLETVLDGSVLGNNVTSPTADFAAVNIGAGSVVVVGTTALEVMDRLSATTLTVSRLRADVNDPILPPDGGNGLKVTVYTFARLIRQVEDDLLRRLGLDPQVIGGPQLVNFPAVARLAGLRTVAAAYATVASISTLNDSLAARATLYADRAATVLRGLEALVDIDGDGVEDALRRPSLINFNRR